MISAYQEFTEAIFKDKALLVKALAELGYKPEVLEYGEGLNLYGYQGDVREETAEIVLRRQHIEWGANDIGFRKTPGGYVPVVSEYDNRTRVIKDGQPSEASRFVSRLRSAYNKSMVHEVARRLKGKVITRQEGHVTKMMVEV